MAIVNNGTVNSIAVRQLPSGYTRPTVTLIADYHYKRTITLTVLKSTVENATASTTMTNIITNGTIGVTKQVDDILAADYLASATVTAYADMRTLTTTLAPTSGSDVWLDDTSVSYSAVVDIYVKAV